MAKNPWPSDQYTTAVATLVWPHVHAPDTRFDEEGKYETRFVLSAADAKPLVSMAQRLIKEAKKKGLATAPNKAPYTKLDDGTFEFRAKSQYEPMIFDAQKQQVTPIPRVGGGTKARVAGTMRVYEGFGNTGVTLYLHALQIIDLQEFSGNDAESFGFDATEGFAADDANPFDDSDPLDEDEDDGLPWEDDDSDADDDDFEPGDF
jgi:hypothetical protein